jgi:hypothetical protein
VPNIGPDAGVRARRVGPYSSLASLRKLDRRTSEGRFAKRVRDQLIDHVGGAPTVAQSILIEMITLRVLRVAMLADHVARSADVQERDDRQLGAWMNGLRRDLEVLGLQAPEQQVPLLHEYLSSRRKMVA